jgi:hypothetical protein
MVARIRLLAVLTETSCPVDRRRWRPATNDRDIYTINSVTAVKDDDGSITVQFGGSDDNTVNCLPILIPYCSRFNRYDTTIPMPTTMMGAATVARTGADEARQHRAGEEVGEPAHPEQAGQHVDQSQFTCLRLLG